MKDMFRSSNWRKGFTTAGVDIVKYGRPFADTMARTMVDFGTTEFTDAFSSGYVNRVGLTF